MLEGVQGYGQREREGEMDHPVSGCTRGKKQMNKTVRLEMIPSLQRVDHNKVFELMELKRLCCCSAGPHSAYRCTAVVTFASADQ